MHDLHIGRAVVGVGKLKFSDFLRMKEQKKHVFIIDSASSLGNFRRMS